MDEMEILRQHRKHGETVADTKARCLKEGIILKQEMIPAKQEMIPAKQEMIPAKQKLMPSKQEVDDEGFSPADLVTPRWKIVQPTSRVEGAKEGHFHNSLTGEVREKLEGIVFLKRKTGRVLFPKNDFSGARICWSDDNIVPSPLCLSPISPQCKSGTEILCASAEWGKDEDDRTRPPKCMETMSFLGLEIDTFSPFVISFHGLGIPPVRNFISTIYLKRMQAKMKGGDIHLREFKISISAKLQMNDRGKFYIPVFEKIEQLTVEAEKAVLDDCFACLSGRRLEAPDEPPAQIG